MQRLVLVLVLWYILPTTLFAQAKHEILLMSGKTIEGTVTSDDSLYVYYTYYKRSGKDKDKKLDLERVFSVTDEQGEERMIYVMDTAVGNYFTVDEMRLYIRGEQDAMKYYSANWTIAAGLPITSGLGYALSGTIFAFAVPFVYLVGTGVPKYKIPKDEIGDPSLVTKPAYVLGFERTARNKRLFKSLVTGLVGTAIGFTIGQTVNQP